MTASWIIDENGYGNNFIITLTFICVSRIIKKNNQTKTKWKDIEKRKIDRSSGALILMTVSFVFVFYLLLSIINSSYSVVDCVRTHNVMISPTTALKATVTLKKKQKQNETKPTIIITITVCLQTLYSKRVFYWDLTVDTKQNTACTHWIIEYLFE